MSLLCLNDVTDLMDGAPGRILQGGGGKCHAQGEGADLHTQPQIHASAQDLFEIHQLQEEAVTRGLSAIDKISGRRGRGVGDDAICVSGIGLHA